MDLWRDHYLRAPVSAFTLTTLGIGALCTIFLLFASTFDNRKLPRVGLSPYGLFGASKARRDFLLNSKRLLREGYEKYKNSAYVIQTGTADVVIVPYKYLPELRKFESKLSSIHAHYERHMAYWTGMDTFMHSDLHKRVVQLEVNQNLSRMIPAFAGDMSKAWHHELGNHEVVRLPLHGAVKNVVSAVVSRAIIGKEAAYGSRWTTCAQRYATALVSIRTALRPTLPIFRGLHFLALPARKTIQTALADARAVLFGSNSSSEQPGMDEISMLGWMRDNATGRDLAESELTRKALMLGFAGIDTSTTVVTNAILDLCAHSEWIPILQDEIQRAVTTEGGWTFRAIQRMDRLDSSLKESLRLNSPGLLNTHRKVMSPIQFSDGLVLSPGTYMAVSKFWMAHDAELFPNPDEFQPMRFYDMAQQSMSQEGGDSDRASAFKFASTSATDLGFGFGTSACPGRHFAACITKLAVARLMSSHAISYPDGQTDRPGNTTFDEWARPSKEQEVVFKRLTETEA